MVMANPEWTDVVSIHAPTRGATYTDIDLVGKFIYVSIHAPTRGATGASTSDTSATESFNPRTHTGCDG